MDKDSLIEKLKKKNRELEEKQKNIDMELKAARELQDSLLPHTYPEMNGFSISTYYSPASHVGGDYYDFFESSGGHIALIMADASGHGIPAAFVMVILKLIIRTFMVELPFPSSALSIINNILCKNLSLELMVSMFYGVFDPKNRILTYSSGGHYPPFLYRKKKNISEDVKANGTFLGIISEGIFEEDYIQLEEGDKLLLFTDGLIEAKNKENKIFGTDRLKDVFINNKDKTGDELISKIVSEVDLFTKNKEYRDDRALLLLEINKRETHKINGQREELSCNKIIELVVPAEIESLKKIREKTIFIATDLKFPHSFIHDITYSVNEVCSNAAKHAYKGRKSGDMSISYLIYNDKLTIVIKDTGTGFDKDEILKSLNNRVKLNNKSYGLLFAMSLMDEVDINSSIDKGTIVSLSKKISISDIKTRLKEGVALTPLFSNHKNKEIAKSRIEEDILILTIKEDIYDETVPAFRDAIFNQISKSGRNCMVINFNKYEHICNAGFAVLMSAFLKLQQSEGEIVICSIHPYMKRLLKIAGICNFIRCFENETKAIEYLKEE